MTHGSISGADVPAAAHPNHGRTVAAWVTTGGVTLAALLAAFGIVTATASLMWAGGAVAAAALVAGAVLKGLAFGQPRR